MKKNSLLKVANFVIIIVIVGKILGLVKQMVVSSIFGTTIETDIIALSQDFVSTIQYILTQIILTAFTSIYIHIKSKEEAEANKFILQVLKLFLIISSAGTLVIVLSSPLLAKILAPSYEASTSKLLTNYLRIYSLTLVPFVCIAIFSAILNSNNKFILHELSTLIQNIIFIIITLILSKNCGYNTLVIATFSYVFVSTLYLFIVSKKYYKLKGLLKTKIVKSDNIKTLLKMIVPLLVGYSMIFVNQQVDKIIVSGMKPGTVTCLSYGASLSNLITTLEASVCTIFFTRITTFWANGEEQKASTFLVNACCIMISIILPVSIITVLCSQDIVSIIFMRGEFGEESVITTAYALMGYGFSFVPFAVKLMFEKFYYGNKHTAWPMIVGFISLAINILLSILLSKYMGILGITLASSIAETISTIILIIVSIVKYKAIKIKKMILLLPYWIVGGALSVLIIYLLKNALTNYSYLLRFIIITLAVLVGYCVISLPIAVFKIVKRRKGK